MQDEADFLRALASDPGDDVARLAFADWLEERGDPRGRWVRDPAIFRWLGPDLADPVPALLQALRSDDHARAAEATAVLIRVGAGAVPALLAEIEMGGPGAEHAGRALAGMPKDHVLPILDRLLELADASDEAIHSPAINALQAVGPAALPALPALIRALPGGFDHWQSHVAELAVQVLKNLGPAAAPAVWVLLEQYCYPETQATEALVAIGPAGVPKALEHIGNLEPDICLRAAESLEQMGDEVVPLLLEALEEGEEQVRVVVALALARRAPEAALPHLLEALQSDLFADGDRDTLLEAIGEMGPTAASAAPTLRRLFDEGAISAYNATDTLSRLESPEVVGQGLLQRLRSTDPQDRARALALLQPLKEVPAGAGEAWRPLLRDSDPKVRKAAVFLAGQLAEPGDAEALAALRPLLRHNDPALRQAAVLGCQRIGGPDLASDLLPLVEDDVWDVRDAVLSALQSAEGSVQQVAEALCRCLEDPHAGVRDRAYRVLAARPDVLEQALDTLQRLLAADHLPAVPHVLALVHCCPLPAAQRVALLRRGLSSQHHEARSAALYDLCYLLEGGEGKEESTVAIPELLSLNAQDPMLAWSVGEALERMGPSAVPHLLPHLEQGNEHVQGCVLRGLKGAGVAALPALPGLLGVLRGGAPSRRQLAAEIVARIGPAAGAARNELLRLLRDQSGGVRQAAVEALGALGPAAGVLSAVSVLAGDDSVGVRAAVLRAVAKLGAAPEALALLSRGLEDGQYEVRRAAVEGLIVLGEPGREALRGLREDEDKVICFLVAKALDGA